MCKCNSGKFLVGALQLYSLYTVFLTSLVEMRLNLRRISHTRYFSAKSGFSIASRQILLYNDIQTGMSREEGAIMAELHELIERVADEKLREELREAAGKLLKQKKFGLVFEDHQPFSWFLFSN